MSNRYGLSLATPVLTLVLLVASGQTAAAQYAETESLFGKTNAISTFLELTGIAGDATSPGYENEIDIFSYSHGISNLIVLGGGSGSPKPNHTDIVFTKFMDKATALMLKRLSDGQVIDNAKIDFVEGAAKTGGAMPMLVMRVELEDAYLTSYSSSFGVGLGDISEAWSMLYSVITITTYNASGLVSGTYTYDVAADPQLAASVEQVRYYVDGEDVIFTWRTLSESGNYGFEIQHLENEEFRRAAYVPSAGWSSEPLEYDVRIRGLQPGIHSFRLASLGVDGTSMYSHLMRVALGVPDGTTLAIDPPYPNPFSTTTNLAVVTDRTREARVSVFDALGREVQVVFEGTLDPGAKTQYTFDADDKLAPGMYFIRVQTEDQSSSRPVILTR